MYCVTSFHYVCNLSLSVHTLAYHYIRICSNILAASSCGPTYAYSTDFHVFIVLLMIPETPTSLDWNQALLPLLHSRLHPCRHHHPDPALHIPPHAWV